LNVNDFPENFQGAHVIRVRWPWVEDQADWDFLQSTDCHLAQGYFIARPMPQADIPGWIETWQARLGELLSAPVTK